MNDGKNLYRTWIQGRLVQQTALSVGGAEPSLDSGDACYRDGLGRLVIPGTALAGALIETACRVFPTLIQEDPAHSLLGQRITGKQRGGPPQRNPNAKTVQSVWNFENSHVADGAVAPEWRQGVGIRQATGATAQDKRVLFDVEALPAGTRWRFRLEIDTFRGGPEAETIALLALNEWALGYGWLGRSPARGMGWVRLEVDRIVRLPRQREILEAWPDNRVEPEVAIERALKHGAQECPWDDAVTAAHQFADDLALKDPAWERGRWHYATVQVVIQPGPHSVTVDGKDEQYGYDVLQVSGHPAEKLVDSNADPLDRPLSVGKADDWRGDEFKQPDAPFVTTIPQGTDRPQPFVLGSGLRGPLRHTASRLARSAGHSVIDPNDKQDATAKQVRQKIEEKIARDDARVDDAVRPIVEKIDQLAGVFGLEELSSRLLVSDANLANNGDDGFRIARVEHHSEDEFAGGVFAEGKFDSNVLLRGQLAFSLVVEASDLSALEQEANKLVPALSTAELGHVPVGAGKWRGAGWLPWQFGDVRIRRVGQLDGTIASTPPDDSRPITAKIHSVFGNGNRTTEEDAR